MNEDYSAKNFLIEVIWLVAIYIVATVIFKNIKRLWRKIRARKIAIVA